MTGRDRLYIHCPVLRALRKMPGHLSRHPALFFLMISMVASGQIRSCRRHPCSSPSYRRFRAKVSRARCLWPWAPSVFWLKLAADNWIAETRITPQLQCRAGSAWLRCFEDRSPETSLIPSEGMDSLLPKNAWLVLSFPTLRPALKAGLLAGLDFTDFTVAPNVFPVLLPPLVFASAVLITRPRTNARIMNTVINARIFLITIELTKCPSRDGRITYAAQMSVYGSFRARHSQRRL